MTFDDFSAGSGTTNNAPEDNEQTENEEEEEGHLKVMRSGNDMTKNNEQHDEGLEQILKTMGATSDDVKEFKFDLDLTKP